LDNPKADAIYREFDQITLFSYWNSRRWLVDDCYQSILPLLPYKSTLVEYTIEERKEITIQQFFDLIQTFSACQTYRQQEGEKAFQDLLENLRGKLIECYRKPENRNNEEETSDFNAIQFTMSNSIRLYLMKKQ
jgi:hypothetical protein